MHDTMGMYVEVGGRRRWKFGCNNGSTIIRKQHDCSCDSNSSSTINNSKELKDRWLMYELYNNYIIFYICRRDSSNGQQLVHRDVS